MKNNDFFDVKTLFNLSEQFYDPEFRRGLRNHDPEALRRMGVDTETIDLNTLKVVTCPADTLYIPVLHVTTAINETELQQLQAAGSVSTMGSASTGGCFSSLTTTVASLSSAGTVGSGGSADV